MAFQCLQVEHQLHNPVKAGRRYFLYRTQPPTQHSGTSIRMATKQRQPRPSQGPCTLAHPRRWLLDKGIKPGCTLVVRLHQGVLDQTRKHAVRQILFPAERTIFTIE